MSTTQNAAEDLENTNEAVKWCNELAVNYVNAMKVIAAIKGAIASYVALGLAFGSIASEGAVLRDPAVISSGKFVPSKWEAKFYVREHRVSSEIANFSTM